VLFVNLNTIVLVLTESEATQKIKFRTPLSICHTTVHIMFPLQTTLYSSTKASYYCRLVSSCLCV